MYCKDKIPAAAWPISLDVALEVTWLVLIFLLPIYFNPFGYEAFYLAKSLLIQFIASILLGVFIAQWLLRKQEFSLMSLREWVVQSPLQIAVIVFGIAWCGSTIFSIIPAESFWGSLARKDGLISTLSWIAIFFVMSQKMHRRQQLYRALVTLVISAGIVSLFGIFTLFYPKLVPGFSFQVNGRVYSTEGNPLSLSGFLSMVLPITLALMILAWYEEKAGTKRTVNFILLSTAAALQMICLYLAQYSITVLLFIPGILILFLLWGIFQKRKATIALCGLALLLLLSSAGAMIGQLMVSRDSTQVRNTSEQQTTIAGQAGLKTLGMRLDIWKCALDVILDSPEVPFYQDRYHDFRRIIGYGPGSFVVLSQTRYPNSMKSGNANISMLLGQPENHYLYLGVTIGVFGLIAFIAIMVIFFFTGLRLLFYTRRNEIIVLTSAFIAGIAQYCIHLLFNPTAPLPELMFWMILSFMVVLNRISARVEPVPQRHIQSTTLEIDMCKPETVSGTRKVISMAILAAFLIMGIGLTCSVFLADMKLCSAIRLWNHDTGKSMNAYMEAVRLEPQEAVYYGRIGHSLYLLALAQDDATEKSRLLALSTAVYKSASELEPYLAYWSYVSGDVYSYWATQNNPDKWDDAIRLYERADKQLPANAEILNKWALALMLKGDYQAAGLKIAEARKADPSWSQNSYYGGLLKSLEGYRGEAGVMFVQPEKGRARLTRSIYTDRNDIEYFNDFCRQAAIYGVIDRVADDLNLYVADKSDWVAWSLLGIADIYAERGGESIEAFSRAAELISDKDIPVLKGVILAFPWKEKAQQEAADNITAFLTYRQAK